MPTENNQRQNTRKVQRRLSPKAALVLFITIVAIAVIGIIIVKVNQWRNDGARYASSLAEQIGVSPETAQKYARMTLSSTSEYAPINMTANGALIYESKEDLQVSGVTIPEWVIFAGTVNNVVTDVTYYDYGQLKKYGNGVQTSDHIGAEGIHTGMDQKAVQEYVGFAPFCTKYNGAEIVETYKYYFNSKENGDVTAYFLNVTYRDGKAAAASEQENHFILSLLTIE